MAKARTSSSSSNSQRPRPALSPEARESQLISYAMDLAERQLLDGTASSQVITHFLKAGTAKYELEKERLKTENILAQAKAEALNQAKADRMAYDEIIKALKSYSGKGDPEDYDY